MEASKIENLNDLIAQDEIEQGKLYTLINKEEHEKTRIPIDPNLQNFQNKENEIIYAKYLLLDKSEKSLSSSMLNQLLIFFLFLALTSICFLAISIISFTRGEMKESHLIFHILNNTLIPICSLLGFFTIQKPYKFIKTYKMLFSGIGMVYFTYLILCNKYILSALLNTEIPEFGLPFSIAIIGMSIMLRSVLCNSFFSFALVNVFMLFEYILATMAVPSSYTLENFSQFFCVFICVSLLIVESKHADFLLKQDFWLQFQYEKSFKTSMTNKFDCEENQGVCTETEFVVHTCDEIKKTLKHCCSIIIFKDIKNELKIAQIKLENIRQKIGRTGLFGEIKIEHQGDIDPDDRKFISENCIDFSYISSQERSISKLNVCEFKETTENFPFSHYGIDKLESILSLLGKNWSFDIWFIHNATGQSISIIGKYLFRKWRLNEFLSQDPKVSDEFFVKLELGYNKNPYHNACHAADVLHSQLFFIFQSTLSKSLNQLDIVSCIIAALGHDIGHPSLTNRFLVNNCDEIAITYNDGSVLENMHAAKTFGILRSPGTELLKFLVNEDWLKCRKMVIEMILETDMSKHFEILGKFRTRAISLSNIDIGVFEDKCQVLGMAIKCADIGHSAKDYDLHEKWSMLVCEEFFKQGDIEKSRGQAVSMYCDRETTDIPKSQSGFIKNICIPLFEVWAFYLNSDSVSKFCLEQLKKNLEFWAGKKKRRATVKPDCITVAERLKRIQTSS